MYSKVPVAVPVTIATLQQLRHDRTEAEAPAIACPTRAITKPSIEYQPLCWSHDLHSTRQQIRMAPILLPISESTMSLCPSVQAHTRIPEWSIYKQVRQISEFNSCAVAMMTLDEIITRFSDIYLPQYAKWTL